MVEMRSVLLGMNPIIKSEWEYVDNLSLYDANMERISTEEVDVERLSIKVRSTRKD